MTVTTDPYERFLGIHKSGESMDLFTLLGLDNGESNPSTIRRSLQLTALKLQQANKADDPAGWRQVVELVRKAQTILLDDAKRSEYIEQRALELTRGVSASNRSDALAEFLPSGDPDSDFDMASYLQVEAIGGVDLPPAQDRLSEWQSLLNPAQAVAIATSLPFRPGVPKTVSGAAAVRQPVGKVAGGSTKIVRRRKSWVPLVAMFGGAIGFLAFAVWMFQQSQNRQLAQVVPQQNVDMSPPRQIQPNDDKIMPAPPPKTNRPTNQRSGLPSVRLDNSKTFESTDAMLPPPVPETSTNSPDANMADTAASGDGDKTTEPMKEPEKTPTDKPTEPTAEMTETEPSTSEKTGEPTAQQWQDWSDAMNASRAALSKWDIDKCRKNLTEAEPLSITDEQKKKRSRAETLCDLVEKYKKALIESLSSRSAAETIKVGSSTEVAFVAFEGERLTVRVGQNKTYLLHETPLAMANAFVDLVRPTDDPITKAMKSAVAIASPKKTVSAIESSKKWIGEAIAADAIDADFVEIFDDVYTAPE